MLDIHVFVKEEYMNRVHFPDKNIIEPVRQNNCGKFFKIFGKTYQTISLKRVNLQ